MHIINLMHHYQIGQFSFHTNTKLNDVPKASKDKKADFLLNVSVYPDREELFWNPNVQKISPSEFSANIAVKPGFSLRDVIIYNIAPYLLVSMGHFILHGSAVEKNHKAYGFIGFSGMGKSTIAKSLMACGHKALTDDCIVIKFDSQNQPYISPYLPEIRQWVDGQKETFFCQPSGKWKHEHSVPIEKLFFLNPKNAFESLTGKIQSILPHVLFSEFQSQEVDRAQHANLQKLILSGCCTDLTYEHNQDDLIKVQKMISL